MTTERELDRLLARAGERAFHSPPAVDVDHLAARVASARERRRSRRLTALRVGGVGAVLTVLLVWTFGYANGVADVVNSLLLFAVPALVVLRWQLEALDGGGLRPWTRPRTVIAWAAEVEHRSADLTRMILALDRVRGRLVATVPAELDGRLALARADVDDVRDRLVRCRNGAATFVASCRTAPAEVDWRLQRDVDPTEVTALMRGALVEVDTVVRYTARFVVDDGRSDGDGDGVVEQGGPDRGEALRCASREIEVLVRQVGRRCAALVDAFDRLHHIATSEVLERALVLGAVRRATSAAAVRASGWRLPAAHRSATRCELLLRATDGGPSWGPTVRRARAAGRDAVLVGGR